MSDTFDSFSASDPDESYRSLSMWAIFAFIASLLSAVSLISVLLWFVPVVAILIGLFALRAINRRPESLTGSGLVLAGMAIAAFFLAMAPVRSAMRRSWLESQAKTYSIEWLEMVREGRASEAYHLTLAPASRSADLKTVLERHPYVGAPADQAQGADFFFLNQTLQKILDKPGVKFEFVATARHGYSHRNNADEITLEYRGINGAETFPIFIMMRREQLKTGTAVWSVGFVQSNVGDF